MEGVFLDFFGITVDDERHRLVFLDRQSRVLHPKVWASLGSWSWDCCSGTENTT